MTNHGFSSNFYRMKTIMAAYYDFLWLIADIIQSYDEKRFTGKFRAYQPTQFRTR